jgi:hypothetical protein
MIDSQIVWKSAPSRAAAAHLRTRSFAVSAKKYSHAHPSTACDLARREIITFKKIPRPKGRGWRAGQTIEGVGGSPGRAC